MGALSNRTKTEVNISDVPKTSDDMTALFEWKVGDPDPKGTHALAHEGMKRYIDDIRNAPLESDYEPIFINTLQPIGHQLKNLK